jgi:hypothetical protein
MTDLDFDQLANVTGGMRLEGMRLSTNVEDRRSPQAIKRDNEWWQRQHSVPLPPRRPEGL